MPEADAAHSDIQMEIPASAYLWVVEQWVILISFNFIFQSFLYRRFYVIGGKHFAFFFF